MLLGHSPWTTAKTRIPAFRSGRRHRPTGPLSSPAGTSNHGGSSATATLNQTRRCILVSGEIVGWVDFDSDRTWLLPKEVNIGYNVFPSHRASGYASSAVRLLFNHLATNTEYAVATLLVNLANDASIGVARRLGCQRQLDLDGNAYFKTDLKR